VSHRAITIVCLLALLGSRSFSQSDTSLVRRYYGVAAGLGVSLVSAPDIVDYINVQYAPATRIDNFGTGAEFFGNISVQLSESWGLKLDYAYLLKSYDLPQPYPPNFTFSYGVQMPTLVAQFFVTGKGYVLKFGGGAGYHLANFTEETYVGSTTYHAHGIGLKLDAEGDTAFDDHLFSYIGADIRGDFLGDLATDDGRKLVISSKNKNVKMNFFTIGLKFGLTYYF
jgi:hypothetical protein